MHDAAVLQKKDRLFFSSVHQAVTAVWGMGGKAMLVHLVLDAVAKGRLRHYKPQVMRAKDQHTPLHYMFLSFSEFEYSDSLSVTDISLINWADISDDIL